TVPGSVRGSDWSPWFCVRFGSKLDRLTPKTWSFRVRTVWSAWTVTVAGTSRDSSTWTASRGRRMVPRRCHVRVATARHGGLTGPTPNLPAARPEGNTQLINDPCPEGTRARAPEPEPLPGSAFPPTEKRHHRAVFPTHQIVLVGCGPG